MNFHYDTCGKLREIFADQCNLSMEQYEEISGQLIYLVADFQEREPQWAIENRIGYLQNVVDFLFNTKELTVKQHTDMQDLISDIWEKAVQTAAALAVQGGTRL